MIRFANEQKEILRQYIFNKLTIDSEAILDQINEKLNMTKDSKKEKRASLIKRLVILLGLVIVVVNAVQLILVTTNAKKDIVEEDIQMYENMMDGIHTYENSFILCHDIKDYTVGMMDRFITDALKEGYTFLPITSETRTCHHGINN